MKIRKPRSTIAAIISMVAVSVSCSDVPATNPTAPTRSLRTGSTQQSTLAPVLSIEISPRVEAMRVGETLSFSVNVQLGEGVPPSGPMPFWSSTNPAVIFIDVAGNATAVGKGVTTIEVIFKGLRTSRNIQVAD